MKFVLCLLFFHGGAGRGGAGAGGGSIALQNAEFRTVSKLLPLLLKEAV